MLSNWTVCAERGREHKKGLSLLHGNRDVIPYLSFQSKRGNRSETKDGAVEVGRLKYIPNI